METLKGLKLKYFILKPKSKFTGDIHAAASRKAMRVYAQMIKQAEPELYVDLTEWANKESEKDIQLYGEFLT
jgi:hypothetical protein